MPVDDLCTIYMLKQWCNLVLITVSTTSYYKINFPDGSFQPSRLVIRRTLPDRDSEALRLTLLHLLPRKLSPDITFLRQKSCLPSGFKFSCFFLKVRVIISFGCIIEELIRDHKSRREKKYFEWTDVCDTMGINCWCLRKYSVNYLTKSRLNIQVQAVWNVSLMRGFFSEIGMNSKRVLQTLYSNT